MLRVNREQLRQVSSTAQHVIRRVAFRVECNIASGGFQLNHAVRAVAQQTYCILAVLHYRRTATFEKMVSVSAYHASADGSRVGGHMTEATGGLHAFF